MRCPLDDGQAGVGDPGQDDLEGLVIVDQPPERRDILGGGALQQEAALMPVEPEAQDIARGFVDMQPARVGAEAPPVDEPLRPETT